MHQLQLFGQITALEANTKNEACSKCHRAVSVKLLVTTVTGIVQHIRKYLIRFLAKSERRLTRLMLQRSYSKTSSQLA